MDATMEKTKSSPSLDRQHLKSETRPYVWLKLEFERMKSRNPRYSLRAFARSLNLPSGRVSEYLSNKRQITLAVGEQIAQQLKFEEDLKLAFLQHIKAHNETKKDIQRELSALEKVPKFEYVSADSDDRYRIVADWHHFAILSLMELTDFESSTEWIAKKLGLPKALVNESLERLERAGIVDRTQTPWKVQSANLRTTDGGASVALQEFHIKNLEMAIEKLTTVPVEDRDFSAITVAIDKAKLPFAKGMIRDFRRKLTSLLEAGDIKNEVYRLSIQFFPLNENKD